MLTKNRELKCFEIIQNDFKTASIKFDMVVYEDGVEISRSGERRAFVPGDIEKVKSYIGLTSSPEIEYLKSIWTQDIIDSYNQSRNNL